MEFTFVSSRGVTVIAYVPDRTPEEQAIADKEVEDRLINIYRQMEREGRAHLVNKDLAEPQEE